MIDRIFCALLTFCLLAGGTVAIGSALIERQPEATPAAVVVLPAVTVIGKRATVQGKLAQGDAAEPAAARLQ